MIRKPDINSKKKELEEKLKKQQYAFIGKHSAVKICEWTKKSIVDKGVCYKEKFYGIRAHRCAQISVSVGYCQNKCIFCWREINLTLGTNMNNVLADNPSDIIKKSKDAQKKLLNGFGGHSSVNLKKLKESCEPMHYAISLTGDALLYPKLNELIRALHLAGKTTFIVTNGLEPDAIKNMEMPTQLYISLDAPDKESYKLIDRSSYPDAWPRLQKTLELLKELKNKTRTVIRITLIKESALGDRYANMKHPEKWASLLKKAEPIMVEVKAYMFIGSSRQRMTIKNMPNHNDVLRFSEEICKHSSYKIIDQKKESRVVLLAKKDFPDRIMTFDDD